MSWTKGGVRKPNPEPGPPPPYTGPKGPTVCAERSLKPGWSAAFGPCDACDHNHIASGGRCDFCRFEVRLQALENLSGRAQIPDGVIEEWHTHRFRDDRCVDCGDAFPYHLLPHVPTIGKMIYRHHKPSQT